MDESLYISILAPFIIGLLQEKRVLGYLYRTEGLILLRFDRYCANRGLDTVHVSRAFLDDWCGQTDTEGISNHNKRVSAVRQLMLYMISLGINVYLPKWLTARETVLPHIFTAEELSAFFHALSSCRPVCNQPVYYRLSNEYNVLFRMIYCCGLRNSEGCKIATDCVNLDTGTLTILGSKGRKDRSVFMSEDLTELCREYYSYLFSTLGCRPDWFFPGKSPKKPLPNTTVDNVFNRFWNATIYAERCSNKPTVHDLRFTFVTDRINEWALEGINPDTMMPYLSRYLGHKGLQETYYYYHNSGQLYDVIRKSDRTSVAAIPEVTDYAQS